MTINASQPSLSNLLIEGPKSIHLIGVAGSGMSGIAAMLLSLGHRVAGSDLVTTVETERLEKLGLQFHMPQTAAAVRDAEIVVYSSAIRPGNPAFDEAVRLGMPLFRRAEALAALMERKKGIVIAGMHGKTTVSAMAAHVLRAGKLHPSHYVGAEIPILGTNAHWDPEGEHLVAEGDESDGTLSLYHPEHAIILNIEEEHLDYYKDLAAIEAVFLRLLAQTRGKVFYCADDANAARICGSRRDRIAFGRSAGADYSYARLETHGAQSTFDVLRRGEVAGSAILNVPGRHNVVNALAVIALAMELGMEFGPIADALATFRGAKRRFEEIYRSHDHVILDDYGHHPTEIKATIETARQTSPGRLVVMFQPHRYTRTKLLKDAFGPAFAAADVLVVTDVYPASEPPIPGISGRTIVEAVEAGGFSGEVHYQPDVSRLHPLVARMIQPGDLILSLGAGNIHEQARLLAADVRRAEELRETMAHGLVRLYEPLSKHTTLRIGGPAQFWVEPETEVGFGRIIRYCRAAEIPLMVVGRGSNLLVRDGGIRGVVVHLARGEFSRLDVDGTRITAGVGVKLKQLSYTARDAGIGGFEWFEGIPGTVGGGLRMNAGAMGSQTLEQVVELRYLDADGNLHTATPDQIEVHYRNVPFLKSNYALSATFAGRPGTREQIESLLAQSMLKRRQSQPAASSAGCIFKNPPVCPAGKLVEELGLKNATVGDARVSEVHGNFIVNDGSATAGQVLSLIQKIQATAREKRGIELETEVQIVGEERS